LLEGWEKKLSQLARFVYEFGLTSRSPAHRNGASSGVHQWKVGGNGETKQLEELKKGRISIMASDGR